MNKSVKIYIDNIIKYQLFNGLINAHPTKMKDLPDVLKFCEGNIQLFLPFVKQFSEKSYPFLKEC